MSIGRCPNERIKGLFEEYRKCVHNDPKGCEMTLETLDMSKTSKKALEKSLFGTAMPLPKP